MSEITHTQLGRLERAKTCTEWQLEEALALAISKLSTRDADVVALLAQTLSNNYLAETLRSK